MSQICIAGFNGEGINSGRKAIALGVMHFCGRRVENGTRSQNIAICFEVNLLCEKVNDEVEVARRCFDTVEFENEGFAEILAFILGRYRG